MSDKKYNNVIKYGKFYYPAISHYPNSLNIQCDRCYKNDLQSCIGYEDIDLCLKCVDLLINFKNTNHFEIKIPKDYKYLTEPKYLTRMEQFALKSSSLLRASYARSLEEQNMFKRFNNLTLMKQNMFNNLTYMKQNMFNLALTDQNTFKKTNVEIGHICLQSNPCKHNIKINGISMGQMCGDEIAIKYWDDLGPQQKNHFKKYLNK